MIDIEQTLKGECAQAIHRLYHGDFPQEKILVNTTPKEFTGHFTLVVFPLLKLSKKSPEATAEEIGNYLSQHLKTIKSFNVIKGFLNLVIDERYWLEFLKENIGAQDFGKQPPTGKKIVLEYCGPNTNKPLHLGHIRNMLLGYSLANILDFNGHDVHKVNIYNDRGIAICKSMVAWLRNGNGITPDSSGLKGDHLVGKYYVEYDRLFKSELVKLVEQGMNPEQAEKEASIYKEAQETLRKWEAGDAETIKLWKQMNDWVYEGFRETYDKLGVDFEKDYYESETYLLGKNQVEEGLAKGVFYRKEDGSIWVNLTDKGLDEKILLRSDGTSVYLTQDLGTAQLRYEDFKMDQSIYVVANEQDYHFQVLKLTLEKLEKPYAAGIHHLSYGMVDLPSGKMKSREGTVVDADDLVDEMRKTAAKHTEELGKIDDFSEGEAEALYAKIGLGALKFHILRVDPKKRMLFDPKESIDFHGQTGPFVQYTYARIQSVLRKSGQDSFNFSKEVSLHDPEVELLVLAHQFPSVVREAGENFDPSSITNYAYQLAKTYNKFYTECPILKAADESTKQLRLALSYFIATLLRTSLKLLGIEAPEKM